ncbi:MAG: hypothetical protein KGN02_12580 [bacterium]|nr:hypothetical protein [bacterium]
MKRLFASLAAVALAAVHPLPTQAGDDLLARMAALNPGLRSYTATMHAHVALRSFPFLATDLAGTYYFKSPDRSKLEITSGLPMKAKAFSSLYAHIEPPVLWPSLFAVTQTSDENGTTTFALVPRKRGNVARIDVRVDDATATIRSMRWNYENGGYAEMNDTYGVVQGNSVVVAQTGHVQEPGYTGDITSTLSDYKINAPISDTVFDAPR